MSKELMVFTAWVLVCAATLGSLFFSEVMAYPPCALCWYQRICMYPLVLILIPAILKFDRNILNYSLPIATVGWLIAIYHNLVYYGVVDESLSPCSQGVSCKAKFIQWGGVIDIPQLSLLAFTMIVLVFLVLRRKLNEK